MGRALTVVAAMLVLASPALARPNVVVVMTDDQDARSVRVMDTVRSQLRAGGTTFENFFATFPLCCPSRATFLTGQYAHNHSVSSYEQFDDSEALPVWLQRAGYRTGFIGKYLNGYDATRNEHVPPGWTPGTRRSPTPMPGCSTTR